MKYLSVPLGDEQATVEAGQQLSRAVGDAELCIYLYGELGAGKTTLCRGIVQGYGHSGAVKSPTYTLVEPYELVKKNIFHFDLYRLADASELEYLGIDEYFRQPRRLCLIEWPDRGSGFLPAADLSLSLAYPGPDNAPAAGRLLNCEAHSKRVEQVLEVLKKALEKCV